MNEPFDDLTPSVRAARFQAALDRYDDAIDEQTGLIDVLSDARHWCDANERGFAEADRIAHREYLVHRRTPAGTRPKPS